MRCVNLQGTYFNFIVFSILYRFTKQSTKITKCRFPPRINYQLDIKYKVKIEKNGNFGIRTNSCHFP